MGTRKLICRESLLHTKIEALRWAMKCMLRHVTSQIFGTDIKNLITMLKKFQAWPNFDTKLDGIMTLQKRFQAFKINYIPRVQNGIFDSFARIARSFHRDFCFVGCFIPVWLFMHFSNRIVFWCQKKIKQKRYKSRHAYGCYDYSLACIWNL